MHLSGYTQPFAVLGHPIGHTLSPVMHNASFRELGMDAVYLALDVHPDQLMNVLPALGHAGFRGVNLTVPLKEVAYENLTQLDISAGLLGAVNTVAFTDEGLVGHNTDGAGFQIAVEEAFGPSICDETVLVLGTGGAGRAVALVCAEQGAARIVLSDLDEERARKVAGEIYARHPELPVDLAERDHQVEAARAADLIIQSTPIGMNASDPSLLPPEAFKKGQKAFDLIYMYPETAFLKAARSGGAQAANGLGMLLHQGARAFTIWTGRDPALQAMRQALEQAVYGT